MAFPVLFWRNLLQNTGAIITSSSESDGFAASKLSKSRPWDPYKSAVLTTGITIDIDLGASGDTDADTIALVNTNLSSMAGTIEVKADAVTNPPTTVRKAAFTPASDEVSLATFTAPGVMRYWRITLGGPGGGAFPSLPFIGDLALGLRTTMPEYLDAGLDPFMTDREAISARSKVGHYLGSVLRGKQHRQDLSFGGPAGIVRTFFTSELNAFIAYAEQRKPYYFQVDSDDASFSTPFFVKLPDGAKIPRIPVSGTYNRIKMTLPVEEAWSERA